ncbi:Transporter [Acidilobus saccharovorans 345-15]|uniref:Transporter n=1 Tax=Acidilobus saccharovorans (strain DSM 16705 / JCM 18335 / VKM B-2471 / 345-15) TaxID=666510 RepID=D9PZT1_ACIS3|nr:MFS transporter [Acidilobus saccharovorans]ADL18569.1 Transporter [Acidilobus saccharovorans 345-15]
MNIRTRSLLFTSVAHFLNDSFLVTVSILITYYIDMHVSPAFLGGMAALVNVLSGLASPLISNRADRAGSHVTLMTVGFILIGASMASFAGTFVYGGVARLALIGLGSVLLGLGLSFYHPLGGSILQYSYEGQAGRALGINGSAGSVGRAIFPTVMTIAIAYLGGSEALAIIAAYVFILTAIISLGLHGLRMPATKESAARSFSRLSQYSYLLVPLTAIVFIRAIFMTGVMTYVPTYVEHLVRSRILMGVIVTTSYATAIVGQPLFGWMVSRYGGRSVIILTTLASTALYIAFLFTRGPIMITTLLGLYSFFAMSGFPVLLGYVSEVVDRSVRAQANSIVWGIGNTVGGSVGALLGGFILQGDGLLGMTPLEATMWAFAAFAVASSIMLVMLPRGPKAQQARQP